MKQAYTPEVIETLEAAFGELSKKETSSDLAHENPMSPSLAQAILSAVHNAVDDNISDYLPELTNCLSGSGLNGLENQQIADITHNLLCASVSYMLLYRCGIDAELFASERRAKLPAYSLPDERFRDLYRFDTAETVTVPGTANGDISEMGPGEIASTVPGLQRRTPNHTSREPNPPSYTETTINNERGNSHGRTDIHRSEWDSLSRPDPARRTRSLSPAQRASSSGTPAANTPLCAASF